MGGKSSSSNSTTNAAYDNRVLHQEKIDYNVDASTRNDYEVDASTRNEVDASVQNDLGDNAIQTQGDVTVNTLDGGAIEDAFNFAKDVSKESIQASSDALSQAFSSTAGGVIDAGRELLKYGGLGLAAIIIFMIYNRGK